MEPIQCGTLALEGGKSKQTGTYKFYFWVFPCCGVLWGLGRGSILVVHQVRNLNPFRPGAMLISLLAAMTFQRN